MTRRNGWQAARLAALVVALGGCGDVAGGVACPAIGLASGFAVVIEKPVAGAVAPSAVGIEACQDGVCRTGRVDLHTGAGMTAGDCAEGPQDTVCSAMASADGRIVGFWDEPSFHPGMLQVSISADGFGPVTGSVVAREVSVGSGTCRITGFQALLRISGGRLESIAP